MIERCRIFPPESTDGGVQDVRGEWGEERGRSPRQYDRRPSRMQFRRDWRTELTLDRAEQWSCWGEGGGRSQDGGRLWNGIQTVIKRAAHGACQHWSLTFIRAITAAAAAGGGADGGQGAKPSVDPVRCHAIVAARRVAGSGRRRFDLVSELRHSLPTVTRPSQQVHYASPLVYRYCPESRIIDTVILLISKTACTRHFSHKWSYQSFLSPSIRDYSL